MKTIIKTILFIIFFANTVLLAQFGGGIGTKENPYQIFTKEHLKELNDSILHYKINEATGYNLNIENAETLLNVPINRTFNKHYILMNDIDSVDFVIGSQENTDEMQPFMGHFNGNLKTINLMFNSSNNLKWVSLFFASTGVIDSLIIDGNVDASLYNIAVTGVTCFNFGSVAHCTNNATINGIKNASGIVFYNYGKIEHCTNNGNITVMPSPGGTATETP